VVANAASYALRQVRVAPFASLEDGWLDICVFEKPLLDKVGFVSQVVAVLARRHLRDPRVRYYRARRIEIEATPPIQVQVDGDMFGQTPLVLEALPGALTVFVP
jgi:diacylglycerol kinase (ATP)